MRQAKGGGRGKEGKEEERPYLKGGKEGEEKWTVESRRGGGRRGKEAHFMRVEECSRAQNYRGCVSVFSLFGLLDIKAKFSR